MNQNSILQETVKENHPWSIKPKLIILGSTFILILTILVIKGLMEGWFSPRTPLDFHQQPAILFFNQTKGCECAVKVYQAAANQVVNWPEENRRGVQLFSFDINQRPDLVAHYQIIRAPAIILVDRTGKISFRQDEAVSDITPLRLQFLEKKILEVLDGK